MTVEVFQKSVQDWITTAQHPRFHHLYTEHVDDKEGKPIGIHLMIGRRPLAAFGNSTGDREMLEYTQDAGGRRLMMLVHHDDAPRKYAYGPASKVGTFSDALLAEATKRSWVIISMKNDCKRIFAWEK
jgi:hypothetical protein